MEKSTSKIKEKKQRPISIEDIYKNIGFLGTRGKLIKALIEEKNVAGLK